MTQRKATKAAKRKTADRKLKLGKETLKDLDASQGAKVRGGGYPSRGSGMCSF